MAWECDFCKKEMSAVCHHCGRPLCRAHGAVIEDEVFAASDAQAAPTTAVHCRQCKDKYHPRIQDLESQHAEEPVGTASP
jgi:NMD protein affecting ribosome stability and mRNA decay